MNYHHTKLLVEIFPVQIKKQQPLHVVLFSFWSELGKWIIDLCDVMNLSEKLSKTLSIGLLELSR